MLCKIIREVTLIFFFFFFFLLLSWPTTTNTLVAFTLLSSFSILLSFFDHFQWQEISRLWALGFRFWPTRTGQPTSICWYHNVCTDKNSCYCGGLASCASCKMQMKYSKFVKLAELMSFSNFSFPPPSWLSCYMFMKFIFICLQGCCFFNFLSKKMCK